MKNILFPALLTLALFSCEKTVELDLEQVEQATIIEGLITDQPGRQYVRISRTMGFYDSGQNPAVSGAAVTVEDDEGNAYSFVEQAPGYYVPGAPFTGKVGATYTLTAQVGESVYTAAERMNYVPPFDSLAIRIDPQEQADPEDEGRFYEVLVYIKEPQATVDYYLAKFYRNDTIQNWDGTWAFAYDDLLLSEDISNLPIPFYYAEGDMARVEMYAITRECYKYYLDLTSNVNNDGGMFSGQPANLRTNIEGGAIGYFQVSGLASSEIKVAD
ncbi:MAG: DUF4249 domain-containing protein [Phaeodactylibacter sp.]|nr:DUF4249 domain-containing protein [Phaeodactylibacter sp.]